MGIIIKLKRIVNIIKKFEFMIHLKDFMSESSDKSISLVKTKLLINVINKFNKKFINKNRYKFWRIDIMNIGKEIKIIKNEKYELNLACPIALKHILFISLKFIRVNVKLK